MSKLVPARRPAAQPDVVVLDGHAAAEPARASGALARVALQAAPDVLRLVERSLAARQPAEQPAAPAPDNRVYTQGMQFTETRYDAALPWQRKVTVRTATSWTTSAPLLTGAAAPDAANSQRLRRAKLLGVGGAAALAVLGMLVNKGMSTPGPRRRVFGRD